MKVNVTLGPFCDNTVFLIQNHSQNIYVLDLLVNVWFVEVYTMKDLCQTTKLTISLGIEQTE